MFVRERSGISRAVNGAINGERQTLWTEFLVSWCQSAYQRAQRADDSKDNASVNGRLTRGRTRRDAGCRARRPSRLDLRETHGVTPLATRSRRCHVSRGKRRAAQPAAHLTASRGLTSRPLCGLEVNPRDAV